MARTLRAIELAQFGACRHEKKSIFGLAYEMMVEAAIEAWPTGKTITCPLHILVVLLSGNNMNHWLRSGDQFGARSSHCRRWYHLVGIPTRYLNK